MRHDFAAAVADVIQRAPLRRSTEAVLQADIAAALNDAYLHAEREVRLSARDRVDLMCDNVAIEAKTRYAKRAIYRQLERYAEHDSVHAIVLVTGTAIGMPPEINGKPIYVVSLGLGSLGC